MKEWLSLKTLANEYVDLSERKLREYLGHASHPLPARLVGGKWLVARDEIDNWLSQFPKAGEDTDRVVEKLMKEVTDDL